MDVNEQESHLDDGYSVQLLVWKQDIACSECEADLSTSPLLLSGRLLLKELLYLLRHLWAVSLDGELDSCSSAVLSVCITEVPLLL